MEELDKILIDILFEVEFLVLFFFLFGFRRQFLLFTIFIYHLLSLSNLFNQAVFSESRNSPFILFMKDAEKSLVGNLDSYSTFKSGLERLPDNVIVIGSHTHTDNRKEKVIPINFTFLELSSDFLLVSFQFFR